MIISHFPYDVRYRDAEAARGRTRPNCDDPTMLNTKVGSKRYRVDQKKSSVKCVQISKVRKTKRVKFYKGISDVPNQYKIGGFHGKVLGSDAECLSRELKKEAILIALP